MMIKVKKRKKKRFRRRKRWPILLVSLLVLACLGVLAGLGGFHIYEGNQNVEEQTGQSESSNSVSENINEESLLEVHFIDVGQGDCALLFCDGHAMLIDSGDYGQGTRIQAYLKKQGVEKLDYLVLTHPDADHIGGAPVIITKFEIEHVFMSDCTKDTAAYAKVLDALEYRYLKWFMPEIGSSYALGSAKVTIVGPRGQYEDSNNSSLVLLVEHGENTFLFTGDAQEEAEADLVNSWDKSISVDVLKLAHHGSKTSTGGALLDAIHPQYAVISCGENNSYGFPHAQPLNYLRERNIQVFRTDEQGSIVVSSDGVILSWNMAPSTTWQTGTYAP